MGSCCNALTLSPSQAGHCQKGHHLSQVRGHTALRPGDEVLPCHPAGDTCRVWCHRVDTRHFHSPLVPVPVLHSLPRPEGQDMAALLSQAVLSTEGVYVPVPLPHVPQNLAHRLPFPFSHRCNALPPHPITPTAVPHLLWPPPNRDCIKESNSC